MIDLYGLLHLSSHMIIGNLFDNLLIDREKIGEAEYLTHMEDAVNLLDRGRALAVLDCKMAGETRSEINTLLYHYIVLEDILYKTRIFVEETLNDPTSFRLYT